MAIHKLVVERTTDGPDLKFIRFDNNPEVLATIGPLVIRFSPVLVEELEKAYLLIKPMTVFDCQKKHTEPVFAYVNFFSTGFNHDVGLCLVGGDVMLEWNIAGLEIEFTGFYEMQDFEKLIQWLVA